MMNKLKLLPQVRNIYEKGENIIQFLRAQSEDKKNTVEDILISYDFQSGSYTKAFLENRDFKTTYAAEIATIIESLGNFNSLIEVGVGEATTLLNVLKHLKTQTENTYGFDISWSRLKFAKELSKDFGFSPNLFVADLFHIPLSDNSIDVVYTSHSIEPNGGKEAEALSELYRIARRYVILLEPCYELANEEGKKRMEAHGYVKGLKETAETLGYNVIQHELFKYVSNPLNPTALTIIKKDQSSKTNRNNFVCPVSGMVIDSMSSDSYYCSQSALAYPVIQGIPILKQESATVAAHYKMDFDDFKEQNNLKGI